ncbi:MAG TPA: alpha/beta hydrolase [Nocardioidaceae bacterium]|nr:alpha/beta hydrolase [Nocardioidaceae bacterium]
MPPSTERTARLAGGLELCYDTFGDAGDPALLLVMGLAGPLTWWPVGLCEMLADRGFHVIRYDNRDVGRSTSLAWLSAGRADVVKAFVLGQRYASPYTMADLAADAVGLLDALEVERAHVVGASMGGMIVQTLTVEHPRRVRSLTSVMSSTGRRWVGWQDPRLLPLLFAPEPASRSEYVARSAKTWAVLGSPAYPASAAEVAERAGVTFDRGVSSAGTLRQMLAVLTQPDRTAALRAVDAPTLVVHGLADRMVHVSGGRATAAAVRGSELICVPGMGHDLPEQLWPMLAAAIARNAARAA